MRRFLTPAVAAVVLLLLAAPAAADLDSDLAEVELQIEDLEAAIAAAEGARTEFAAEVLETARALKAVVAELAAAEQQLAATEAEIGATETLLSDLVERIEERQGIIIDLRARARVEREAALARAVDIYMSAHADVSVVFAGGDSPDAGVGLVYANRVQNVADRVIAEYELHRYQEQQEADRLAADRARAEDHRTTLAAQEQERKAAAAAVAVRAAEVEARLVEQHALLHEMDRRIREIEGELVALARDEEAIRLLIAQEQSIGGVAPGVLLRPVPGAVESGFGYRIHPIYGTQLLHTGWDMHGSCGSPIVAAGAGRVIFAGWKGGYGLATMIDHGGGLATLYAHQSSLGVSYGQMVGTGEQIGLVGTTGVSTGCHLHWEVRLSGTPVDPAPYL